MEPRSSLTKRTFVSKIDGKEYVRQMTYDECHELMHNEGRLLSEEYKGTKFELIRFFPSLDLVVLRAALEKLILL